jgi:serine/threonine-protein kinase HipA
MARTLHVYLNRKKAGLLHQNDDGQLEFTYAPAFLNDPKAIPLSHSLPLRPETFAAKECRGFFSGLLPEEENREMVAKNLGITARNDFSMLREIGGESAGAVSFLTQEQKELAEPDYSYRELSEQELIALLQQLPHRPLLAGDNNVRLSLAGAQTKLPVLVEEEQIAVPLMDAPSTHILKPAPRHYDGLVYNEAFCMMLAGACGLETAPVEVRQAGNQEFLLIERYDRKDFVGQHPSIEFRLKERLHQEDFCQALGILSQNKYESEGGPSLKDCFELITEVSRIPLKDRQRLLDAVIFNFLIGNNDAHGKNFSLTYNHDGSGIATRLAPLYDLICTRFYPSLDKKMAMKIGDKALSDKITLQHFETFAEQTSLSKPQVKARINTLARKVIETIPLIPLNHPIASSVGTWIEEHCKAVLVWAK